MGERQVLSETGTLASITLYPVKSLEGASVERAEVLPNGSLKHDRRYSFFNTKAGTWIRAKDYPDLIRIRTHYDLTAQTITLSVDDGTRTYDLEHPGAREALGSWMSAFLKKDVELRENTKDAFFDDRKRERYGVALISTATLRRTAEWFPQLPLEEVQRRMRMNLVVDQVSPFWEEAAIGKDRKHGVQVGGVTFCDPWPCSRCTVPTRDSHTAEMDKSFADVLGKRRQAETPENAYLRALAHHADFKGFFTLGVRTNGRTEGNVSEIAVGDQVSVCV